MRRDGRPRSLPPAEEEGFSGTPHSLNQYTVVGGTSQTYDANGNLTDNGTYKFKYNYMNLICEVRLSSNNNLVATYTYDANGRRTGKVVSGGITQRFIYSDVETVETFDGSNNWKQDFVFDVTGIDRILMLEQADVLDEDGDSNTSELTRSYYHSNALGSVMETSTASQAEAASYRYAPYGEILITRGGVTQASDPLSQPLGFTSRHLDAETGLLYYRARGHDPSLGRFCGRDPSGYEDGASLYEYVGSCPTSFVDPAGRSKFTFFWRALWEVGVHHLTIIRAGNQAEAEAKALGDAGELSKDEDGSADAYRHCLGMCYLALKVGGDRARKVGQIYEEEVSYGTKASSEMDLKNNDQGIDCFERAKNQQDCRDCCMRKAKSGQLTTIQRRSRVLYPPDNRPGREFKPGCCIMY